ncbi:collagen-binding domain-containing protein [Phenylobacterium sp.]|uniref:collagen-binding domain-containing protein n=1 Tax=Phenylobacterium sp. TaxID=1871053 RepID=UPI0012271E8C|nr:collagen-binding domain-containing protein [Phenylobacterium sp.]THD61002.1 MAG: PEP-CTERM sorting domain-containing protein [Phenylobacterium sp.]
MTIASSPRFAAFASVAALSAAAFAATPAAAGGSAAAGLEDLRELNLIVLGNMSGGQDVEGKAYIGGNLSNGGTFGNGRSTAGRGFKASSHPTLTVGGNATGNININNGPNGGVANEITPSGALIGGNAGTVNLNASNSELIVGGSIGLTNGAGGATILAGGSLGGNSHPTGSDVHGGQGGGFSADLNALPGETATITADVKALAKTLAALGPTAGSGFNTADPNNTVLKATNGGAGYAVIDVSATELESFKNLIFNLPTVGSGYLTTIINVTGAGNFTFNFNDNNSAENPYVIWNFEGASTLDFNTQMDGSVLAPTSDVTNHSPIEGTLVAKDFTQGGEVHLGTFAGIDIGASVPEPSAWALMLTGFAGLGAILRRRRAFAAA